MLRPADRPLLRFGPWLLAGRSYSGHLRRRAGGWSSRRPLHWTGQRLAGKGDDAGLVEAAYFADPFTCGTSTAFLALAIGPLVLWVEAEPRVTVAREAA